MSEEGGRLVIADRRPAIRGERNYLTIDFEEWFAGLDSIVDKQALADRDERIRRQADWLLQALDRHSVRATFFVLGRVAERFPDLVGSIARAGHEIGVHGFAHKRVDRMTREAFRADLAAALEALRAGGVARPLGFRAPRFSATTRDPWFWEELAAAGFAYGSSLNPARALLPREVRALWRPFAVRVGGAELIEFPLSTTESFGIRWPFSGGFYLRSLPFAVVLARTRRLNRQGCPVIFYVHPWEFDPDQPRPACVTRREALSHYGFLATARAKFERLLGELPLAPLAEALPAPAGAPVTS